MVTELRFPLRYATRLRGYDYSRCGYYFVTLCAHMRKELFGEIPQDRFEPNPLGTIAAEVWESIPELFPAVGLDVWVVMPNHVHGIVVLPGENRRGSRAASTIGVDAVSATPTLARVINGYKSVSARLINRKREMVGERVWQRSFYDHVIRNQGDLERIREYIVNNPLKWALDEENPRSAGFRSEQRRRDT